jgi:hypothetical protein
VINILNLYFLLHSFNLSTNPAILHEESKRIPRKEVVKLVAKLNQLRNSGSVKFATVGNPSPEEGKDEVPLSILLSTSSPSSAVRFPELLFNTGGSMLAVDAVNTWLAKRIRQVQAD